MHHAFPRECPFPHVAGTTNPQAASDWIEQAGTARATKAEMQKITAAWQAAGPIEDEELTHWTHEEELLVPRCCSSCSWVIFVGRCAQCHVRVGLGRGCSAFSLNYWQGIVNLVWRISKQGWQ